MLSVSPLFVLLVCVFKNSSQFLFLVRLEALSNVHSGYPLFLSLCLTLVASSQNALSFEQALLVLINSPVGIALMVSDGWLLMACRIQLPAVVFLNRDVVTLPDITSLFRVTSRKEMVSGYTLEVNLRFRIFVADVFYKFIRFLL